LGENVNNRRQSNNGPDQIGYFLEISSILNWIVAKYQWELVLKTIFVWKKKGIVA